MGDSLSSRRSHMTITDLDMDTLTRCASYLSVRDVSNMAMSCKYLNRAAYSDYVWQSLYRREWPLAAVPCWDPPLSTRETYLSRHASLHQFKCDDPLVFDISTVGKAPHHIMFGKNSVIFAQGPSICSLQIDGLINGSASVVTLGNHNARVTCMRLFSLSDMCQQQKELDQDDNILVTSSSDHFIRLWSKGGSRCFKGHTVPVCTLSDKLLGDGSGKILASGGEDGTVCLWSIHSSGKRGQHALKFTLHGHEKAVSLMSVAGHKRSLLVSISKNGKVRVWDTTAASSSARSSCCVGMTHVPVAPVDMKCHESLLYVAASSSVTAIDLRTMHRIFTVYQQSKIQSFGVLPSKSVFCTGGTDRAMLWDIRRVSDTLKPEPTVELNGHIGPIKLLHIDSHKVVTGGPDDPYVKIWEAGTGAQTNSLRCSDPHRLPSHSGCSGMAVDGCQIITASGDNRENAFVCYRDFRMATSHAPLGPSDENITASKFWAPQSDSDEAEDPEDPDWPQL